MTTTRLSVTTQALIDSGSAGNFIFRDFLRKLHLSRNPCPQVLNIHSILGKLLGRDVITHCSPTVTLHVDCLHKEKISFIVLEGSTADVILGHPWILQHSPRIYWTSGEVLQWGEDCFQHCLKKPKKIKPSEFQSPDTITQNSSTIESPESHIQQEIPVEC